MWYLLSRCPVVFTILSFLILVLVQDTIGSDDSSATDPDAKVIKLSMDAKEYVRVLGGPPETVTMRSGLVVLFPEQSVGKHSTENYEELLVVLEGEGQMQITNGAKLLLTAMSVAYCPPQTEHDVINTGSEPLRYLYIVAKARQ